MELRQDIIEKTMKLLQSMEQATGFHPDENYYKNIINSLNNLSDEELPGKFLQITEIMIQSIDQTVHTIVSIQQESMRDKESIDRSEELEKIASILNF